MAFTLHPGVQRLVARLHADVLRQIDADGVASGAGGDDLLRIVVRQAHKGIGPGIAVYIDFGGVNAVNLAPQPVSLGNRRGIQLFHRRGKHDTFGGDLGGLSLFHFRHGGLTHFDGRAARLLQSGDVSRGGKVVD